MSRYWRFETGLFLAIWLVLMVGGKAWHFGDPGALWHIIVGDRMLSSGELMRVDPFSFTFGGRPWIPQSWLFECAAAELHRLGGLDSVLLLTVTLLASIYTWLGHRLRQCGIHALIVLLIVGMTLAASSYHFHPRPLVFTIALLGWTFARLCDFEAGRISWRGLLWLIPAFALWANLHAGIVGGYGTLLAVVAGWAVAFVLRRKCPVTQPRQWLLVALVVAGCLAASLATPYGVQMPRVWVSLVGSPVLPKIIQEHLPLRFAPAEMATVLSFGAVYIAALAGIRFRDIQVTWLLPLVWLYLAWTSVRHGPLFAVTAAVALRDMFPHVRWVHWLVRHGSATLQIHEVPAGSGCSWRAALIPAAMILTTFVLQITAQPLPVFGRGWARVDPKACPEELLPALKANANGSERGTLIFNDMLYGGFLIYFAPEYRVFIDDRCELYGDDWLLKYADAYLNHPEQIDAWQAEYGFELALVSADTRFNDYLSQQSATWEVVARTDTVVLYRKTSGKSKNARRAHGAGGKVVRLQKNVDQHSEHAFRQRS